MTRAREGRGAGDGAPLRYRATVGRYVDGKPAEIFLTNHKAGSMAGILASDSAVLASLALQFGVPVDVLQHALMRDARGQPTSPLGMVLDRLVKEGA